MERSRTTVTVQKGTNGTARRAVVLVVELEKVLFKKCEKKETGLERTVLANGSGDCSETAFGSSFTLTVSGSTSLPFPLSCFLFGLPLVLAAGGSCKFSEELEREIEGSSSSTIVNDSESTAANVGADDDAPSLSARGSRVELVPF